MVCLLVVPVTQWLSTFQIWWPETCLAVWIAVFASTTLSHACSQVLVGVAAAAASPWLKAAWLQMELPMRGPCCGLERLHVHHLLPASHLPAHPPCI